MSLARKHELHRSIRIIHHRRQPLNIRQDQIGSFVRRETSRKPDRKSIWAQHSLQPLQLQRRLASALRLGYRSPAHKLDQLRLQVQVRLPKLAVVHVFNAQPDFGFAAALMPVRPQMSIVQSEHLLEPATTEHGLRS